ncbi:protein FAM131C isoform X2 [Anguilla rostrata]|uniref:protein FAM131C isoform X2 n=1 Tax=Anguilla rostrata TaxID=7938 RepID=UPI0030D3303A
MAAVHHPGGCYTLVVGEVFQRPTLLTRRCVAYAPEHQDGGCVASSNGEQIAGSGLFSLFNMGACLCTSHKELQGTSQAPVAGPQCSNEGQPIVKSPQKSSNGSLSDKKSTSGYDIGELATSSLLGLVATIKEHITKPTAMAQGRVAHLIEWKGWSTGAGAEGAGYTWGGGGAGLQVDEQLYSHLTDEIKEARFAAGVAAQFALAEAAMCAWSSPDGPVDANCSVAPLQDPDGLYLSRFLLDGGGVGVSPRPYIVNADGVIPLLPQHPQPDSRSSSSPCKPATDCPLQERRTLRPDGSIRHADSSSLSEDEVFYD